MKKFWLLSLATMSALCFILASACGGHEHTWATEWSSNAEGHFHYATCEGHETVKDSVLPHNFVGGECTVCHYPDPNAHGAAEFTVTYDANGGKFAGGQSTLTQTAKGGEKLTPPATPKWDLRTFEGWYRGSGLSEAWDFAQDTVTESFTLYAKWGSAVVEYDVTFILNYDGAEEVVRSTENGLVTFIPERTDYVFNGWWLSDGQTESGDYILSSKWDTSETVTEEGLTLVAEWVEKSTVSSQLPAPSVSINGSVFSWDEVGGAVSYDVRVYGANLQEELKKDSIETTSWTFPIDYAAGFYTVKIRAIGDGKTTVNSAYVTKSYGHLILGSITKIDFNITTSVLTWTAVKNATSYTLYINDEEPETLNYTTYDLSDYEAGDYTVRIVAKRDGYQSSTTSKSFTKLRLKTPEVELTHDNNNVNYTVTWTTVLHADTYIVTVNGEEHRFTEETSYTFDRTAENWGDVEEIVVTVAAFDSNADYLMSEPSEEKVQRVYKLRAESSDTTSGCVTDGEEKYTYYTELAASGDRVTFTALPYLGYKFVGWLNKDENVIVSKDAVYQFTAGKKSVTYYAQWEMLPEMAPFDFYSDLTQCGIWGPKDKDVKSVTFPSYVTRIRELAFSGCVSLESVILPEGVTEIGYDAFSGCTSLESIVIPESVTEIGSSAFYGCTKLKSVTFKGNQLTEIGECMFMGCTSLKSIVIPEGVKSIKARAFWNCTSLTSVVLPKSLETIFTYSMNNETGGPFDIGTDLEKVYYGGTESDWKSIVIVDDNASLLNATRYYFSENAPTAEQWESHAYWWHFDDETGEVVEWVKP